MTTETPKVADLKTRLRQAAKQRRKTVSVGPEISAEQAAENFVACVTRNVSSIVAGYATHHTELNAWPLMHLLHNAGNKCCLPVLRGATEALQFRIWKPNADLSANSLGILEPGAESDVCRPNIVVTPLLAFDRQGRRLGYGGGYYDRTLRELRSQGKVTAVGFGYGAQEMGEVPADDLDERLDWIVTDTEVIRIEG